MKHLSLINQNYHKMNGTTPNLSPDDFNTFNHPDLNNKSMTLNHGFGRVLK